MSAFFGCSYIFVQNEPQCSLFLFCLKKLAKVITYFLTLSLNDDRHNNGTFLYNFSKLPCIFHFWPKTYNKSHRKIVSYSLQEQSNSYFNCFIFFWKRAYILLNFIKSRENQIMWEKKIEHTLFSQIIWIHGKVCFNINFSFWIGTHHFYHL